MTASIIIVHYKVKEELFICLSSIKNSRIDISYEVIVVDNDEEKTIDKELRKKFPWVRYVPSPENKGFGAGNNLGAKYAKGKYLFFLNPDTRIVIHAINNLVNFLNKNKDAGIVAPLLLDPSGKPYALQGTKELTPLRAIFALSFLNKVFPKNPIAKNYWLADWDIHKEKKVDVVPGTAFMISTELFQKCGKFDEHFFLYFEEYDICKKIKHLGYKAYIIPEAKVIHTWGSSTKKSKKNISDIFSKSRFYYFKKNYGFIWASIVDLITGFGKEELLFLCILVLGIFLRFYTIDKNYGFYPEVGDNLLDIKNAFIRGQIPLIGPPTSHPWLFFGPLFYWLYGPILIFFKFDPITHAYFGACISVFIIIANFYFIKRIFTKTVALLSSFLIAISPLYLVAGRTARFIYIVPLVMYPFVYVVYKMLEEKKKYFFLLGLLLGIMLNFHYTPLFLIPFLISVFIIKKISFSKKDILKIVSGFLLPLVPIFTYDSMHKFMMIKNLLLWIPYRVLGFLGVYHKNTVSIKVLQENNVSFINFFSSSFAPTGYMSYNLFGIFICIIIIGFIFWNIFIFLKKKELSNQWVILFIWGFWGFLAIFIHGSPPLHYFVPIFPFPIIIFSLFLSQLLKRPWGKQIVPAFLLFLTLLNFIYYFSDSWFYLNKPGNYADKQTIAQYIIRDAKGKHFILHRVGNDDNLEKEFAQDYIYLLWWYGNEPVTKAAITYTIVESGSKVPKIKNAKEYILNSASIFRTSHI